MDNNNGTTKTIVDNDGYDGDGGDGKGNGDGNGNGDGDGNADDAAAVNGKDVDEDDRGNSRTAIGRQRWDNVDVGQQ